LPLPGRATIPWNVLSEAAGLLENATQVTGRKGRGNFRGSNWLTGPGLGILYFKA